MSSLDKDRLISAVYSATLSPDDYEETLELFDELIFSSDPQGQSDDLVFQSEETKAQNDEVKYIIDPELIDHFQRAHDIQLRFGRHKIEKSKMQVLIDAAPNPAFVFDDNENIVATNELANALANNAQPKLEDFCVNKDLLDNIREFVANGDQQKLLVEPGYINPQQNVNTCVLVKKMGESLGDGSLIYNDKSEKLYFATIIDLGFDQSKTSLFRQTYGLTPAEVDIAVYLASGKQLPEIAEERRATLATIRTQIKRIKKKTNSRDIPAIVRLVCGFSAGILVSSQISNPVAAENRDSSPLKSYKQLVLRDGRQMSYMEQGDPEGIPVLMIHNMPYGVELPELAIKAASRMNLRIIAPYRPGYGNSDMIEDAHGDNLLNEVARDIYELLDHLAIPTAAIVGQTVGAVYAMRFAYLFPNRVSNLFAVSYAPIWRDEWIATLPKRQRFTVRVTKYMPQLLPLITHATVAFVDKGHAKKLVHSLCKGCAADMRALQSEEITDLMARGCEEGLKQGAEAFRRDCFLTIQDFSEEAKHLSVPFHILHGDEDDIIELFRTNEFAEAVPGTIVEIVKGAGQLLMYSHWEHVLKAIKGKSKKTK